MITNPHPDFVDLQIAGPRTLLSLLDPGRLGLRLDLRGVTPGQADFKIGPEMFRIPRQTIIDRISPAEIRLDIDQNVTRDLRVHPVLTGIPPDGYRVTAVEVYPLQVSITGPRKDLEKLDKIDTEAFDLRDVSGNTSRELRLVNPGGLLKTSTDHAMTTVSVQEVLTYREFRGVQIQVKDAGFRFKIDPRQVTLTLRGPVRQLARLNPSGMVYVDARGAAPGVHELPVQVALPDGLALVHPVTEKVRLRMFAQRAG